MLHQNKIKFVEKNLNILQPPQNQIIFKKILWAKIQDCDCFNQCILILNITDVLISSYLIIQNVINYPFTIASYNNLHVSSHGVHHPREHVLRQLDATHAHTHTQICLSLVSLYSRSALVGLTSVASTPAYNTTAVAAPRRRRRRRQADC